MIIDVNAFLGVWIFRKLKYSGIEGLDHLIRRAGVTHALVSYFESLFYKSNVCVNDYLREIERSEVFIPIAAINPTLPDIRSYLKDFHFHSRIRGFKLHPDYHGYRLSDDPAQPVFSLAEELDMPIIVPLRMSDERMHHRAAKVPPTSAEEVDEAAKLYPKVKIIVCNARSYEIEQAMEGNVNLRNLYVAFSWAQEEGFIASVVGKYGYEKFMWGSNMPLHYPETTIAQIRKADIGIKEKNGILVENARAVFGLKL